MLEGGGLHPKAGSTAHRPREGQGRRRAGVGRPGKGKQAWWDPPHQKQHRNAHTDKLGRKTGGSYGVFAWQGGGGGNGTPTNQPCKTQLSDQDAAE